MRSPNNDRLPKFLLGWLAIVCAPVMGAENVLEEIIVTAQKRSQSLNDVGISVSALTHLQIETLNIRNTTDLTQYIPGFISNETAPSGVPVYTIRGVGFDDYSANSSPTVGFYADEVYLPYPTMTRGPLFDLDRLEILKGPQGTLYGRNTTGGAVKFVSNKPTELFEADVSLEYARYNTFRVAGAIGGSLSDAVNGRLAFTTTQSNKGWQQSSSRDDTLGELNIGALRGILAWKVSDQFEAELMVHWYQDSSDNRATQFFAYVPSVPELAPFFPPPSEDLRPDLTDPRSADWGQRFRPERDNEGFGASATLSWQTGRLAFTSITAFEQFERDETIDWDGSFIENLDSENNTKITAWSEEFRVASSTQNPLEWMVGAYISSDTVIDRFIPHTANATVSLGIIGVTDVKYEQETRTAAAFAQAEWSFADTWRLIGGLRYTYEEREWAGCSHDYDGSIAFFFNTDLGAIPGLADHFQISGTPLAPGDCATIDPARAGFSFDELTREITAFGGVSETYRDTIDANNLTAKVGVDWLPDEDWLIYTSISSGFKSGGFNGAVASSWTALSPYDEEELIAYEVGLKSTLQEGSLQFNFGAFYYDYKDKQVTGFFVDNVFGILTNLVNIPKSRVLGAESELAWHASSEFLITVGLAWLDTEVEEFLALTSEGRLQDLSGLPLAQAPEWQINGLASRDWLLGNGLTATVEADFIHSDGYFTAITDSPLFYAESYTIWNARFLLTAKDEAWNLMVWGKNLGNHYYFTSANIANDYRFRIAGPGRTYGLTYSYFWN